MEKIRLKTQNPWITTYPLFANPLSILENEKYTYNYIYSSFIQTICCIKDGAVSFYDFNYRFCPFLNVQKISKEILKEQSTYVEAIKYFLSKGYYLYLLVNPEYIHLYCGQKKECHDLFVFGFDEEQQLFYIADNFTGKYNQGICTYRELEDAIVHLPSKKEGYLGFNGCIELLSLNRDTKYIKPFFKENIVRIKDSLSNYLLGYGGWNDACPEMRVEPYGHNKFQYGIDCYQFLINNFIEKGISNIHFPSYFLVYDHKKHMLRVLSYLEEVGGLESNTVYKDKMKELVELSHVNVNLLLKDRIAHNRRTEDRIVENYKKMEFMERDLISHVVNDIRV